MPRTGAWRAGRTGGRGGRLISAIGVTALAAGLALPLHAVDAQQPPSASAGTGQAIALDIPSEDLNRALLAFANRAGFQVFYDVSLVRGLRSTAVSGFVTPQQGLSQLLTGTGMTYRVTGSNTVTLEKLPASSDGAMALPPVQVQGQENTQTANGPVAGYVATRSATATKSDTPLIETPQSISVVTRDQMNDQMAQTVPQALRYTASTFDERNGADIRYDYLSARGFTMDQYLNGLKLLSGDFSMPQIDPFALERIEILRGPASVLYGQVSPGGLVNYVSKLPTSQSYHDVEIQTGSYGRLQGAFDLSGPLDSNGKVLYRLTGIGLDTETQVDHTRQSRVSISPAITWQPDADTTLTLLTNYQRDPNGGFYNALPAQGTVQSNVNGQIPTKFFSGDPDFNTFQREQYSVGYLLDHRFNDVWSVHQGFRYSHVGTDLDWLYNTGVLPDQSTITRHADVNNDAIDAITLDNNVQAKFATGPLRHVIVVGFDYQHSNERETDRDGPAPSINFLAPVYNQPIVYPDIDLDMAQTHNQYGIYAQDQIRFGRWAFLIGGRQDWANSSTRDDTADSTTRQSDSAFTWRTGLVYLFDNGVAPYVSYSTSFQPTTGTDFNGSPFVPTKGEQEEVGIKYQPTGFNSFIQAALYNLTQDNVLTVDPLHTNFSTQTGQVRSRGVDLEGKLSLTDGLDVTASYSYVDNVVTKSNTGTVGKTPYGVPRNQASIWANYKFQDTRLAGLRLGAGVRYVGWSYGTSTQAFKLPDYALFDAAVHYDLSHLSPRLAGAALSINADNIFDKTYVTICSTANGCYYGLRRTVLATLGFKW